MGLLLTLPRSALSPGLSWGFHPALGPMSCPGGSILPFSLSSLDGHTGTGTSSVRGIHCQDCGVLGCLETLESGKQHPLP